MRTRYGQTIEISFEYDETRNEQIQDNMQVKQEKLEKKYKATFKRDEYERIANKIKYERDVLPFDTFVKVVRPFMMGVYEADEIRQAFHLLDKNCSNTIDLYELSALVSVIHPNMSKQIILSFMTKVSTNGRQEMDYGEFIQLILEGIGRDIVCGHV